MTPYEQLLALYRAHPERSLSTDLEYFMRTGYVFSTPDYIVIGSRMWNGWFVHAAVGVGHIGDILRSVPYSLPYIGWARENGEIKWYATRTVERLVRVAERLS